MSSPMEQEYMIEEDEIDLRELWQTIKNGKKIIFITSVVIVVLTLVYALKMPNVYKSNAVLIPVESDKSSLGSLGGLAAMAGISIGGGGSMTPDVAFNSILNDYSFMQTFVEKNKIIEHYNAENVDSNYVFALGYRGLYELFKSKPKEKEHDEKVFDTIKLLKDNLSISSDKKTGLITVSYSDSDRTYPPKVINAFLRDASKYLVDNNLNIIESKLKYFQKEMKEVESFELRKNMSSMISNILQEKVVTQSKVYYKCDILTRPSVAYIKDKAKPKRGLILVVAFITSIILGVFLVFFLEFIKASKEEDKKLI